MCDFDYCQVCDEKATYQFYCRNYDCQCYYYFCDDCHNNTRRCIGGCGNKVNGDKINGED